MNMDVHYSAWNRYRLLDACYRLDVQQRRVDWGIFIEPDCLQTTEAFLGIGDVIRPQQIQQDAERVLLGEELGLLLDLRRSIDRLRGAGPVELDGPLEATLSYMRSKEWIGFIVSCQRLLSAMIENGVPGLVAAWQE